MNQRASRPVLLKCLGLALCVASLSSAAWAHDVAQSDRAFVQSVDGVAFLPFMYLGAKHMVTGYDHILFLVGVVFYLQRLRDVLVYVSMFTIGHSLMLLSGVLLGIGANSYVIDAIIGLSVVYKGVENVGGFRTVGWKLDPRAAVLAFGLCHGLGLATKLMDLSGDGLLANLVGFNIGVEIGQAMVLVCVVSLLNLWRGGSSFQKGAKLANRALIVAGIWLAGYQMLEWFRHE